MSLKTAREAVRKTIWRRTGQYSGDRRCVSYILEGARLHKRMDGCLKMLTAIAVAAEDITWVMTAAGRGFSTIGTVLGKGSTGMDMDH